MTTMCYTSSQKLSRKIQELEAGLASKEGSGGAKTGYNNVFPHDHGVWKCSHFDLGHSLHRYT
jgi:hypothetical protein